MLKYLQDVQKAKKTIKMAAFSGNKVIILAPIQLRKACLGQNLEIQALEIYSCRFQIDAGLQNSRRLTYTI